ncbi:MAG: hypothetical protein IKI22_03800 [Neisseriaceae bacterium]|nr:hypothetical protein [Neisseriaceae bacterium]
MQQTKSGDTLILSGNIDTSSINVDVLRLFLNNIDGINKIVFQDVGHVDSSCVAIFVAAKRLLKEKFPTIENIPPTMVDLLKLYNINDWITND